MIWLWTGFILLILIALALDLGVFHRTAHRVSIRESLIWTVVWVVLALLFSVGVYFLYDRHVFDIGVHLVEGETVFVSGKDAVWEYLTGYLIEKSLSLDNIFVIAVIFSFFRVPDQYQHRVLFWGILGALVFRGVMIGAGVALLALFSWMNYVLGGLLILAALKMLRAGDESVDPDRNLLVRFARKFYPVSSGYEGQKFFTMMDGRRAITPLLIVLLVVESTDIFFAIDSIPAIFAVTQDPFIVFTSNAFAILGLRALYFALAGLIRKFRYLKVSLAVILGGVGCKLLWATWNHGEEHASIPTWMTLVGIVGILSLGVLASILRPVPDAPEESEESGEPGDTEERPEKES